MMTELRRPPVEPAAAAVWVDALTKRYGDTVAVDRVSFSVARGEVFGFLGPNGAGKTTTIRMLTGVVRPDEGSARVLGYDVVAHPVPAKRLMGIVPEMANVYIDLSAWNNLMFMAELYGVPARVSRERARELLSRFGLEDRARRPARTLSKGLRQRLLICMALMGEPEILFLDEPTVGLDMHSARLIRRLIGELNRGGMTVFLTTHNIDEASRLCHRIAVMNRGRLAAADTPGRLAERFARTRSVEVSFEDADVSEEELGALPGVVRVAGEGGRVRLFTADPSAVVYALTEHARARGLRFASLKTLEPSLEDAFVEITAGNGGGAP